MRFLLGSLDGRVPSSTRNWDGDFPSSFQVDEIMKVYITLGDAISIAEQR